MRAEDATDCDQLHGSGPPSAGISADAQPRPHQQVADVNRLLKQHAQLRKMMKGLKGMQGRAGMKQLRRAMPFLEP